MSKTRYQVVVTGFGGQGIIFLVKILSHCSLKKGIHCLGTENHGMSQRGGTVVSDIKIGDFHTPVVNTNQANLIIGLHSDEALRILQFLKPSGTLVVNADETFPDLEKKTHKVDAYKMAEKGDFELQALNVFMLGYVMSKVDDFPFTVDEIKETIEEVNPRIAPANLKILDLGMSM